MRKIELENGNSFMLHDCPSQLRMNVYSTYNKFLLLESGIGGDVAKIDEHFTRVTSFIEANKVKEAKEELANFYYNLFHVKQKTGFISLAFCCLVDSINGRPVLDYSEDGLKRVGENLSMIGLTQEQAWELLDEVKKNSRQN